MLSRDYRDIVGGGLLIVGGLLFSWYAATNYDMGTLRRMGPGMFPAALGITLALFGMAIAIPAFFKPGPKVTIRIWTPLFIMLGVGAFALMIRPFGLLPAIVAVTVLSSFAELRVRPVSLFLLCAVLCVMSWLIFSVGLGLPMAMYRWPF
jgi:hypothetical protein